nr:hypothetical protein [Microbacterium hydrocarbonoxydans]
MTSLHTLPIAVPLREPHEHAWITQSRHPTSEGIVVYVQCANCAARRVDLQSRRALPPTALSRPTATR